MSESSPSKEDRMADELEQIISTQLAEANGSGDKKGNK